MEFAHVVLTTVVVGIGLYGLYAVAQADRKLKRIKVRVKDQRKR